MCIAHLRRTPFPPESPLNTQTLHTRADWRYELSGSRQHYLIEGWIDGVCIGRAHGWFEPGARFVIEKIEMDRAHRSKGYGSALIEQLREKAREAGCSEIAFLNVRAANRGAIRLYTSLGAVAVERPGQLYDYVIAPP